MEFDINNLTLIDLISEKHTYLRKKVEQRWNNQSEIHFSHSEWHLLAKIEQKNMTISQAGLLLGISRQAMQKSVKKLETKGYITSSFQEGNKRDKFLYLTKIGKEYCQRNNKLKIELELELQNILGKNEVERLKKLFIKKWLVE